MCRRDTGRTNNFLVIRKLKDSGSYPASPCNVQFVLGEIAKSLVFRAGERAVVAIMSGDNRLDTGKLAEALGHKVSRADADFVRAATGFSIGGVPPLGHATPAPVFMDADLFRFDRIWAAAGSPFSVFAIEPARLRDAGGAAVTDLKVD